MKNTYTILEVTPSNVREETLFCIKNIKSPGFHQKEQWFSKRYKEGLRIFLLKDSDGKVLGFIEFAPAENAWRPINAPGFMFVQCLFVYPNKNKNKGNGSLLLSHAEQAARKARLGGICAMTSKGSWMTDKRLFEKNGFEQLTKRGRFELLSKKWDPSIPDASLRDWTVIQKDYQGWNLVYADQCPWHEKAVEALWNTAQDHGIELRIKKLTTFKQAQNAPSGFGVFSLLHDGRLLEDHYISATRFQNILKKEMSLTN